MSVTYPVTNLNDHGAGSLRQAVLNANAHPGTDIIDFKVGGTIALTTGQLTVTDSVQIVGPGAAKLTISGDGKTRILDVANPKINVSVSGVTFTRGNPGIAFGGAVSNFGKLSLSGDVFTNNVAASFTTGPTSGGGGAAIENAGSLYVSTCTFDSNTVYVHDGSGIDGGGAIYNNGYANISRSTFSNNVAQTSPSALTPLSAGNGAGIYNNGSLLLTNSTLYYNNIDSAFGVGGGLFTNSTAASTVINCTFSNNTFYNIGGDVGSLKLGNTIVANFGAYARVSDDVSGGFTSLGNNLIGYSGDPGWLPSDIVGASSASPINPLLGALAYNGGPTKTLAISNSSPARAHGSVALATSFGLTTDQRGLPRVELGKVDIGAFEL